MAETKEETIRRKYKSKFYFLAYIQVIFIDLTSSKCIDVINYNNRYSNVHETI